MMKKLTAIILTLVLSLSLFAAFPFSAAAAQTEIIGGTSMSNAQNIPSYGVSYVSSLTPTNTEAWFKFTPKNSGKYTIYTKDYSIPGNDNNYMFFYVFDAYSQNLNKCEYMCVGQEHEAVLELEANATYYIKVSTRDYLNPSGGNFELKITAPNGGGQTGGGTEGIATIINNITTVVNNIFITIKNPIMQLINTILNFITGLFN